MHSALPTIWIVDDSALDASRVAECLSVESRYHVETFSDGSAAIEALATSTRPTPALVVVDWVMPGVSGTEFCRYVRASKNPAQARIALLMLTVASRQDHVVEGLSAGADDFVVKPFMPEELRARVATLVKSRTLLERAEAAEALNLRLLNSTPDALFAVDAELRITYANAPALRALGGALSHANDATALVGTAIADLVPAFADIPQRVARVAPNAREVTELRLPDVVIGERTFSPTARFLNVSKSDALALAPAMIVSLRDVTERRALESRRLDLYSMVAHDLRSPLSALMQRADLLLRGRRGVLAPRVIEDVRKIDSSLKSLLAMINDFLELARFENTSLRLEREPIDLAELVADTMRDLMPLIEANSLTWVARDVDRGGHVVVDADRRRLTQVLTNLVGNAIKFTPPGGTIFTEVSASGDDDTAIVAIEDTGRGIDPAALPTLFDRYTRALDAQHEVAGTGLGLMIVKEIVEGHEGTVGVESTQGRGSKFWFRVPRARNGDAHVDGQAPLRAG